MTEIRSSNSMTSAKAVRMACQPPKAVFYNHFEIWKLIRTRDAENTEA
jgi:hypothetical protein